MPVMQVDLRLLVQYTEDESVTTRVVNALLAHAADLEKNDAHKSGEKFYDDGRVKVVWAAERAG